MENLFIAIKIEASPRLIRLVRNTQVLMRKERIRWVPDVELHIRLASINENGMSNLPLLKEKMQELVSENNEFLTTIRGFGNVGSHSLSAGIDQTPEFLMLRQSINDLLAEYKEVDSIDFVPNILIARINNLVEKRLFFKLVDANRHIQFDDVRVKELCLISCELMAHGPLLTVIDKFSLQENLVEETV